MPIIPKPIDKPLWATTVGVYGGKTNAIKPPVGLEAEGWQYTEKPPRNYMNWLHHWTSEWIDYLEAMTGASQRAATFIIASETSSDEWKQAADYVVGVGTDASLIFEAAIAAMPALGGRILLSEGYFYLQTQFDFGPSAKAFVVQGQGPGTRLVYTGLVDGTMVQVDTCEHVQFQDLTLFSGTSAPMYVNGIKAIDSRVMFHGVRFDQFWSDNSGTLVVPKGVALWSNGSELLMSDCDVRLAVTAVSKSEYGVAATSGSRLVIHDTRIWAGGTALPGNAFRAGIAADGSVVIANGNVIERAYDGILLSGAACADSQIVGNEIKDVAEYGVFCEGAVLVGVHGNTMRNPGSHGIYADAASAKVAIEDNAVFDCGFDGVVLAGTYSKANNNLIGSCRNGLVVSGSNNRTAGNIIDTSSNNGIEISGEYNAVDDNRVDGSAIGIEMTTAQYCHVHDNQVRNSSGYHLILRVGAANNSVCDNMALPGAVMPNYGLKHETAGVRNNLVSGNFLRGCGTLADLWIQGGYVNALVLPAIVGVDAANANLCVVTSEAA